MKRARLSLIRLAVAVLLGAAINGSASAQEVKSFLADLALFVCEGASPERIEGEFEAFLSYWNFRVLNLARISRERAGMSTLDVKLIGLDEQSRTVDVVALPGARFRYALTLDTPPPTQHYWSFETAVMEFIKEHLKCDIRQQNRYENGPEASSYFEEGVGVIRRLIREEDERTRRPI